jgi:hypothetical protein
VRVYHRLAGSWDFVYNEEILPDSSTYTQEAIKKTTALSETQQRKELTLILMLGAYMTPKTLKINNSQWTVVKKFFLRSIPHKMC